ncbi:MAG: PA2778 family cysteine peptidase [Alphaproteobacteria bacterium]|nr:PA2778 family cysteine peptidase [Alphaproteobacteria bacterium]
MLAVGLLPAAAACSTPQTDWLRRHPDALPAKGAVERPVFFAQRTKECGPAALAMVLAQSGLRIGPDELVGDVYNLGREGSLTPAVVAAARRRGRIAYPVDSLRSVLRSVNRGRPVIVLQNLGLDIFPRWHYAVVVAYDLGEESITLHSGKTEFLKMPLTTFEHTWSRGGHWGLLTLRPGEFPEPVEEKTYVTAVAGVERAGQVRVAARAYEAATKRWPRNLIAWIGLGNTLYKLNDRRGAAAAFRTAAERHPKSAAALNNLAHVLAELGEFGEAEQAARKAVAVGGPSQPTYRKTLESILDRRNRDGAS